jgi:hypothetical protein
MATVEFYTLYGLYGMPANDSSVTRRRAFAAVGCTLLLSGITGSGP